MAHIVHVEPPVSDGQRLLSALAGGGFPVEAAGWLQSPETGGWELYIVTPAARPGHLRAASRQLQAALAGQPEANLLVGDYQLRHPDEPVGRDILAARTGWTLGEPVRGAGGRFGELAVDGVYIYPAVYGKTTRQLFYGIIDLLHEPLTPDVTVRLHDRSTRTGIPVGVARNNGELCLHLFDRTTGRTEWFGAGQIVDIRRVPGTPMLPRPQPTPAVEAA